jgi:hypothetical protein
MDEQRFPQLVRELQHAAEELGRMFPGRPFTLDGHLVGSLGECLVSYHYGVQLLPPSCEGCDARYNGLSVEIKATFKNCVALRSGPQHLIAIRLLPEGAFEEVYNGPGAPA